MNILYLDCKNAKTKDVLIKSFYLYRDQVVNFQESKRYSIITCDGFFEIIRSIVFNNIRYTTSIDLMLLSYHDKLNEYNYVYITW